MRYDPISNDIYLKGSTMLIPSRATNILLVAILAVGIALVAMLASGVRGGPLDPPGAPGSTLRNIMPAWWSRGNASSWIQAASDSAISQRSTGAGPRPAQGDRLLVAVGQAVHARRDFREGTGGARLD